MKADKNDKSNESVENAESVCYGAAREELIGITTTTHEMVSAAVLAKRLGLAASTVRQYVREGRIPVALRTPGGHGRFVVEEAQAALAKSTGNVKKTGGDSKGTSIARRTFAPVALTGEGEVRVKASAQDLPISEDWQLRLAVGAVSVVADDFGDLEPAPVIGVAGGARFVLDNEHALAGV
jgi:hypothetical protein